MVDNADWLLKLNYVDFIREYGVHFTVNKMLTADAYRTRFERGLTFFEFNYMIMQAYDFLQLFRQYNCKLQMGGNDQWSNILAGADLIRRAEKNPDAECFTVKLLLTSEGKKMGKSQKGAVWLDPNKTSPHEFFQYWRNIEDADVIKCMKLVTFLPMNEIQDMEGLSGGDVNKAKEKLAYEVTKLIHGSDEAEKALKAARSLFGGAGGNEDAIPLTEISSAEWGDGMNIVLLLEKAGLIASRGEGRKLIRQGGIRVNDKKIDSFEHLVTYMPNGRIMLQKGKKTFHRIKIV
jgi:tyrosyl-tRNA synthetase